MSVSGGANDVVAQFGRIDIYLFDQIMRGRITPQMRILDAGCGGGRNAHYLLRQGANVFGIDADPGRIAHVRALAAELAPDLPATNFQVGDLGALPHADGYFDAVVCSAVLHFAQDSLAFEQMVNELWRVLAPGGVLFARLASTIGIEDRVEHKSDRWYGLPDGTDRFLVDEAYLLALSTQFGGQLLDPLKTTNVQNMRAMTTWVLGKEN